MHEVRRDVEQDAPFPARFEHEMQVAVLQIAHAAVHEPRRPAGGAAGEVLALDEHGPEPAQRGVAGDAGAGDAAADHQQVHGLVGEAGEELGAGGGHGRSGGGSLSVPHADNGGKTNPDAPDATHHVSPRVRGWVVS